MLGHRRAQTKIIHAPVELETTVALTIVNYRLIVKLRRADAKTIIGTRRDHQETIFAQKGFDKLFRLRSCGAEFGFARGHIEPWRNLFEAAFVHQLAHMPVHRIGPFGKILAAIGLTWAQAAFKITQGCHCLCSLDKRKYLTVQ